MSVGLSLSYSVGSLQYVSNGGGGSTSTGEPFPVAAVGGGVGGGGVLVVVVVAMIVIISVVVYGRSSKRKNAQVASLLMQMKSMESAMADECKRGVCPCVHWSEGALSFWVEVCALVFIGVRVHFHFGWRCVPLCSLE